jgi:hypothetical protein
VAQGGGRHAFFSVSVIALEEIYPWRTPMQTKKKRIAYSPRQGPGFPHRRIRVSW